MNDLNKYRGNSHASKSEAPKTARKPVEQVLSSPPRVKQISSWGRMRRLFLRSDATDVREHLLLEVIVPSVQDLLYNFVTQGAEFTIYDRPGGRSSRRGSAVGGNRYTRPVVTDRRREEEYRPRELDRRERATHDFSGYLFPNASSAEKIADRLFEQVEEYGSATVADFYTALGITPEFTDANYGWTSMMGTKVRRTRDGYILDLPRTEPLD